MHVTFRFYQEVRSAAQHRLKFVSKTRKASTLRGFGFTTHFHTQMESQYA